MKVLVKSRNLSIEAARGLHEGVLVPTLMYGCKIWCDMSMRSQG